MLDGNFTPFFLVFLNCCGLPLAAFGLGIWVANGMPGSPFILRRRGGDGLGLYDD